MIRGNPYPSVENPTASSRATATSRVSRSASGTQATVPDAAASAEAKYQGSELIRETKRYTTENRARSWWYLLSTLTAFAGAIGVACLDIQWGIRLAASLLAALLHVRLFCIYHDYLHSAIFRGSRLADAYFSVYGLLVLAPPSIWKHTHNAHHRNNARKMSLDTVGTYPLLTIDGYRNAKRGERLIYHVSRHPLTFLFGYLTVFLWGLCLQPLLRDFRRHKDVLLSLAVHLGVVVSLAIFLPQVALFAVVLPWFLASALGAYLFYAQHNFPAAKLRTGEKWSHVHAALRASSFMRMSPIMHWFTANIGYHHVHHLNSRIPFYRLPEAMAAFKELQSAGTTSLHPADIVRCLRLKLWDPDEDRLVTLAEARQKLAAAA